MRDGVDFQNSVARFSESEAEYLVDLLRGVYDSINVCEDYSDSDDSRGKLLFGDLICALDECERIEINSDEVLIDEG